MFLGNGRSAPKAAPDPRDADPLDVQPVDTETAQRLWALKLAIGAFAFIVLLAIVAWLYR